MVEQDLCSKLNMMFQSHVELEPHHVLSLSQNLLGWHGGVIYSKNVLFFL